MAFGQPSGMPATAKQVQELLTLLHDAGHTDFRDARGPLGLTQRQAAGKFTRDEATEYIDRLQDAGANPDPDPDPDPKLDPRPGAGPGEGAPARRRPKTPTATARPDPTTGGSGGAGQALRRAPTEHLVDELRRRGWTVSAPAPGIGAKR